MSSFFNYFPSLFYSNTAVTNIIAKVRFDESVTKNFAVFYPYTVTEGERPDQIAQNYYEDASYDWVVYLSNGIVDPYHEWPKTQEIFEQFITQKYGSTANAQAQIAYYKVNYETDETVISPAAFNALAAEQKQYWSPIMGPANQPINYQRKEIDSVVETNKIVSLTGSFGAIAENTILKQSSDVRGTVVFANTTNLVLKHISGDWDSGESVYVGLTNELANATVTDVTTISTPISSIEQSYWSPVYVYDVEFELNEQNKHIRLLSNAYLDKVETDMKDLMST